MRFYDIIVCCPNKDNLNFPVDKNCFKMQMCSVDTENGKFFLPCNGCDEFCGADICQRCTAAITLMFHRGFRTNYPSMLVVPDLSLLAK